MKKCLYFCFLVLLPIFSLESANKAKMLEDLDVIKNVFEVKYAPKEWKKEQFGWDLNERIKIAKVEVLKPGPLTVKGYQKILHAFFRSICDFHVQDLYYSTEMALLPFGVKGVNGKYFISSVNEELLDVMQEYGLYQGSSAPCIGDELLTFDSQPIAQVITQIVKREVGNLNSRSSWMMAESLLTVRLGSCAHEIPKGMISLKFKHDGQIVNAQIEWLHFAEKIMDKFPGAKIAGISSSPHLKLMINPLAQAVKADHSKVYRQFLKNKKISLSAEREKKIMKEAPKVTMSRDVLSLGEILWKEESSPFSAYIYSLPGTEKRAGYIRIRDYMPSLDIGEVSKIAEQLVKILQFFEDSTDALVIDQVDNSGGYALYCYAIASMMAKDPLVVPKHHMTITQKDVSEAFDEINELEDAIEFDENFPDFSSSFLVGYPNDLSFKLCQLSYDQFIIEEWNAGKTYTSAFPLHGIEKIMPHPDVSYTKPILILVDAGDYSCADFFPAILRDANRAVIFGEQTAGAGGAVEMHTYPNAFGVAAFSYTATFARRPNGEPLENLGVSPDVPYKVTEEDVLYGYRGYIRAVNQAVEVMLFDKSTIWLK